MAARDEYLLAIDDVVVAITNGLGAHGLDVTAAGRLTHAERGNNLTGGHSRQPALLLFLGTEINQIRRNDVGLQIERGPGRARRGEFLDQDRAVQEIATGAVGVLNESAPGIVENRRVLRHAEGETVIIGVSEAPAEWRRWNTPWINVDGKLGVITAGDSIAYLQD